MDPDIGHILKYTVLICTVFVFVVNVFVTTNVYMRSYMDIRYSKLPLFCYIFNYKYSYSINLWELFLV
jgi:hypothetical protein